MIYQNRGWSRVKLFFWTVQLPGPHLEFLWSSCPQFYQHQTPARFSQGRRTSTDIFRPGPNTSLVRQLRSRLHGFAGEDGGDVPGPGLPGPAASEGGGQQASPTPPAAFPVLSATVLLSCLCLSASCPDKPPSQSPQKQPQQPGGGVMEHEFVQPGGDLVPPLGDAAGLCGDKTRAQELGGSAQPRQQWKSLFEGKVSSCFAFFAHKAKAKTKPKQGCVTWAGWTHWDTTQEEAGPHSSPGLSFFSLHHPSLRACTRQFWCIAPLE